ncbi:MAG: winged helix-turn-helix transcriptional regulator [Chloroflexi bacterium]|jgi:ArsR family transcriptional regulator, virulence genes transcriptional regulator|nr:winged helix-turn-helix transcriptional regulator [Chloroflexota bacterium]MBT7080192.1 winged helix-turn-helix transcriptional regulator [Chloroflexota bacterium]MBT7290138.1 winged helix-turn-helix transcriptional regulator [Chloroflexota bacterium]
MDEMEVEILKMQADICKTFSDYKRLMIVHLLREGEKSVSEIIAGTGLPQANVSQHLSILRKHGVVLNRREGANVYYSLTSPLIGQACDLVKKVLEDQLSKKHALADSLGV